jgi:hypothetical protein
MRHPTPSGAPVSYLLCRLLWVCCDKDNVHAVTWSSFKPSYTCEFKDIVEQIEACYINTVCDISTTMSFITSKWSSNNSSKRSVTIQTLFMSNIEEGHVFATPYQIPIAYRSIKCCHVAMM